MRLDPALVRHKIEALKVAHPDLFDAEEDWLLVLDSETDLNEFLDRLILAMQDAAAMAGGLATAIADMEIRQARFVAREKAMRRLALDLMRTAGLSKAERPLATLSIRNGSVSVHVDDAAVPAEWRKPGAPDKTKIKEALQAGSSFNWAALVRGDDSLSVRVK